MEIKQRFRCERMLPVGRERMALEDQRKHSRTGRSREPVLQVAIVLEILAPRKANIRPVLVAKVAIGYSTLARNLHYNFIFPSN